MAGLLGRARDEENERLLADQQAAVAALAARLGQAERKAAERGDEADRLRDRCAALEERIEGLQRALDASLAAVEAAETRLARLELQGDGVLPLLTAAIVRRLEAEAGGGEQPDVPTALGRLDRQLKAFMDETDRAMRALAERMEEGRRPRG